MRFKMEEEDEVETGVRFFKIMLPGFEQSLKLPPEFCDKVKHEKSTRAVLESCIGKWEMKVCRGDDDDEMILESGWPGFVHDHGLGLKDFLVFKHTAKLHFDVMVFDVSGCLKEFPNIPLSPKRKSEELTFGVEITPCMASKKGLVTIPMKFVRSNNLLERRVAILEDARGRRWRVSVYVKNWPKIRRVMYKGWRDFVSSNEVKVGDFCKFELIPTSSSSTTIFFHVHISRNKSG